MFDLYNQFTKTRASVLYSDLLVDLRFKVDWGPTNDNGHFSQSKVQKTAYGAESIILAGMVCFNLG